MRKPGTPPKPAQRPDVDEPTRRQIPRTGTTGYIPANVRPWKQAAIPTGSSAPIQTTRPPTPTPTPTPTPPPTTTPPTTTPPTTTPPTTTPPTPTPPPPQRQPLPPYREQTIITFTTLAGPVERGFRTVGPFKGPAIIDTVSLGAAADQQHAHYWLEVLTSFDAADGRLPNGTRIWQLTPSHALLSIYDQEAGLGIDTSPTHQPVYLYVPHSTWYLALCGRTTIPGTILGVAQAAVSWIVLDPEHAPTPQPRPTPRPTPTPTPPTTTPPTTPPTTTPTTTPTTPPTTTPAPPPPPTTPPARPLYITQLPPVVYRTPDGSWRTGAGVRPYSGGILIRTAVALLALSLSLAACTTHVTGPLWQTPHNANTTSSFDGRGEPTPRPIPANHND